MKIYTKTGDDGTTGLFGGQRVAKYDVRVEAYGTVDELNAILGVVLTQPTLPQELRPDILHLSTLLFTAGSDIATPLSTKVTYPIPRLKQENIEYFEQAIDVLTEQLPPLKNFILPGGTAAAAHLHHARTVCRRAERLAVALTAKESTEVNPLVVIFLNRCSDYLFTAARAANFFAGTEDTPWINV